MSIIAKDSELKGYQLQRYDRFINSTTAELTRTCGNFGLFELRLRKRTNSLRERRKDYFEYNSFTHEQKINRCSRLLESLPGYSNENSCRTLDEVQRMIEQINENSFLLKLVNQTNIICICSSLLLRDKEVKIVEKAQMIFIDLLKSKNTEIIHAVAYSDFSSYLPLLLKSSSAVVVTKALFSIALIARESDSLRNYVLVNDIVGSVVRLVCSDAVDDRLRQVALHTFCALSKSHERHSRTRTAIILRYIASPPPSVDSHNASCSECYAKEEKEMNSECTSECATKFQPAIKQHPAALRPSCSCSCISPSFPTLSETPAFPTGPIQSQHQFLISSQTSSFTRCTSLASLPSAPTTSLPLLTDSHQRCQSPTPTSFSSSNHFSVSSLSSLSSSEPITEETNFDVSPESFSHSSPALHPSHISSLSPTSPPFSCLPSFSYPQRPPFVVHMRPLQSGNSGISSQIESAEAQLRKAIPSVSSFLASTNNKTLRFALWALANISEQSAEGVHLAVTSPQFGLVTDLLMSSEQSVRSAALSFLVTLVFTSAEAIQTITNSRIIYALVALLRSDNSEEAVSSARVLSAVASDRLEEGATMLRPAVLSEVVRALNKSTRQIQRELSYVLLHLAIRPENRRIASHPFLLKGALLFLVTHCIRCDKDIFAVENVLRMIESTLANTQQPTCPEERKRMNIEDKCRADRSLTATAATTFLSADVGTAFVFAHCLQSKCLPSQTVCNETPASLLISFGAVEIISSLVQRRCASSETCHEQRNEYLLTLPSVPTTAGTAAVAWRLLRHLNDHCLAHVDQEDGCFEGRSIEQLCLLRDELVKESGAMKRESLKDANYELSDERDHL